MSFLLVLSLLLFNEPSLPEVNCTDLSTEYLVIPSSSLGEEDDDMYLVWNEDGMRDSILGGQFNSNRYDKNGYIKSLTRMQQVLHYSDDNKEDFQFLFTEFPSSRFKKYKNKVTAIIFQETPVHKKLLDEIRYITLDDRFDVHASAGIMPVYDGGYQGILDYLNNALNSGRVDNDEPPLSGNVVLGFVVDKDGQVSCAKILESSNEKLDRKAYELVKSMPGWSPARNGYPVPVFLGIQLIFFNE